MRVLHIHRADKDAGKVVTSYNDTSVLTNIAATRHNATVASLASSTYTEEIGSGLFWFFSQYSPLTCRPD